MKDLHEQVLRIVPMSAFCEEPVEEDLADVGVDGTAAEAQAAGAVGVDAPARPTAAHLGHQKEKKIAYN